MNVCIVTTLTNVVLSFLRNRTECCKFKFGREAVYDDSFPTFSTVSNNHMASTSTIREWKVL